MRVRLLLIFALVVGTVMVGCSDDTPDSSAVEPQEVIEKNVVVVLPMEDGLDGHWSRIFTMFAHNMEKAFSFQDKAVKLNFEYYDESSEDLVALADEVSARDDVYAVIGGLYSENALELASVLCRNGVAFFTPATTEELVRGFASTGNLWAMTETDITQMEVLLSKVVNYGGRSVALIADGDDLYGKTFVDWFAFQAKELGLAVDGLYTYTGGGVETAAHEAAMGDADFVICAPSHVDDIEHIVDAFNAKIGPTPRLLFSDIGYGSDVIGRLGDKAEGIEGVCFGANPETGFDVSFRTYFGVDPTVGAAQLYDAAMLITYAAWYQSLHPESSLRDAVRAVVDGRDFNMGSWMGEDMRNVVKALARGDAPYVRGASGSLDSDSKVYTNVLSTVYYNYKVYDGRYIILDYNTADGGNRTDATLAGWNWKASQMQDFASGDIGIQYGPLTGRKALLVAASTGWINYRHQADVLAMYQLLKSHGYSDDDIILVMEDDVACNADNPEPGVVKTSQGGADVRAGAVVDYKVSALTPEDMCNIVAGRPTSVTPIVLDGDASTNLLIFWSGHGEIGMLSWGAAASSVDAKMLDNALAQRADGISYRKMAMFIEACYSGSVAQECAGHPGMIFYTAANPFEPSKADVYSTQLGVWMGNRFTSTLVDNLSTNPDVSLHDLYNRLFINTVGSHVMVYNDENYGNLYKSTMKEYL